jgi:hypothetical protein
MANPQFRPFSPASMTRDAFAAAEKSVFTTTPAVLVDATTIFTISGGPILVTQLMSNCVTTCDTTASTLQWSLTPISPASAQTFSGASASLASAAIGTFVLLNFTSVSTAPDLKSSTKGVSVGCVVTAAIHGFLLLPGIITTVIGVGSTTGTFQHFLRYRPMSPLSNVSAAF